MLTTDIPTITAKEDSYPFVECATFADDIKYKGGNWQSEWHFIDMAYLDEGGDINDYDNYGASDHNITLAINQITAWLKGTPGY